MLKDLQKYYSETFSDSKLTISVIKTMQLAGIPLRLMITIGASLIIGMLLIDIILLDFWTKDVLRREMDRDRLVLSMICTELVDPSCSASCRRNFSSDSFNSYYPYTKSGLLSYRYNHTLQYVQAAMVNSGMSNDLSKNMGKVLSSGESIVRVRGSVLSALFVDKLILLRVDPVQIDDKVVGVVGVIRNLTSITHMLQKTQKTIFLYITINVLFLGGIIFFRIRSLVSMPLHHLIDIAEQYREDGAEFLVTGRKAKEFNLLAGSLNRMVEKIEQDKMELEKTVAHLKLMNDQLEQQQNEMIRAEKMASVGRIAAGLAHEIGNPIAIVQGYLGLLRCRDLPYSDQEDFVNRSEGELQRVAELIHQLLNFSRTTGQNVHKISLHELLRDFFEMMRGQVRIQQMEIIAKFNAENDVVLGDPEQLRQVFLNCFFNALDAMASTQQKIITIETQCTHSANLIGGKAARFQMSITDSGIGITQEDLGKVFDAFFTTKEPGKGTGLGLFVSYNIIKHHGGRIWLESQKGQGSKVIIELPLAENESA